MNNKYDQKIQGVRLICHKCAYLMAPEELVVYGQYRLCMGCAQKLENLKKQHKISHVEDFVITE